MNSTKLGILPLMIKLDHAAMHTVMKVVKWVAFHNIVQVKIRESHWPKHITYPCNIF
jgi:hypothetical protein